MKNDIRVGVEFPSHRKTKKLRRLLGPAGVDSLISLWCYAGTFRQDGRLDDMCEDDIADASNWQGEPEEFVSGLVECRFLDRDADGVLMIHDWRDHQPYIATAKERSEAARKAAQVRWSSRGQQHSEPVAEAPEPPKNAKRMRGASGVHAKGMRDACGADAERMRNAMRRACGMHKKSIAHGMLVACEPQCPFYAPRNAPYPYPTPLPSPIPIYMPVKDFTGEIKDSSKGKNKRTKPVMDYAVEIPKVLSTFNGSTDQVKNFLVMVSEQNKTGAMSQSRQYSILQELQDLHGAVSGDVFREALSVATANGVPNVNYIKVTAMNKSKRRVHAGSAGEHPEGYVKGKIDYSQYVTD